MTEEKRSYPRRAQEGPVHVDITQISNQQLDELVRFEGAMRDISQSGIRLHGKHPLAQGARLDLLVEIESLKTKYKLHGSVRWVSETTEHEFVAGLEIDSGSVDFTNWQQCFS